LAIGEEIRLPCVLGFVPGLSAVLAPTPETLDYEAVLDRPMDLERDVSDPEKRARLAEALAKYRNPPEGIGSLFNAIYLGRMVGQWFRHASGYVAYRRDWTFHDKVQAFREFARRMTARSFVPVMNATVWTAEEHATKDGSVVFVGADHRMVVVNVPGATMWNGLVPSEERRHIARTGSLAKYYAAWDAS